ncbi:UDP-N-acetylmuramoyl-L-alanyl-D-glutamate--2,6-diaminopimelate ligase, partial [Candidatus Collierbacteria bacterium]|nr:UDP-N-acetylmuramoyl-L-alanyl-D-glutamate--2,6-diaminopimelate ligase [Candidatus Collierbacteria bacterium]
LILVFGCAGLRDHQKRPLMGRIAHQLASLVIITAEDPRTERVADIFQQIISKTPSRNPKIIREDDRQRAINLAISLAKIDDIVVITGKGHEKSICFGNTEFPWSDQKAVRKALTGG